MESRDRMLLSTVFSVSLAMLCFLLVLAISNDFQKTWDFTDNQRHSFSQQTKDLLAQLEEPVKFYAFLDANANRAGLESLLDRYKKLSPRFFSYEIMDLQRNPAEAERLQVRSPGQGVFEQSVSPLEGEVPSRERVLQFEEAAITNGLSKLLRSEDKSAYFVVGHGERRTDSGEMRDLSQFRDSLKNEGYVAKNLSLVEVSSIPSDATLLIMAGPTGELLPKEKVLLDDYLKNHGKLFFLADIEMPQSYVDWLAGFGFEIQNSIIVDEKSASVGQEPVTPIGQFYASESPITRGFKKGTGTAFTLARPLEVNDIGWESMESTMIPLVKTEASAYLLPLAKLLSGESVSFSAEGQVPTAFVLVASGLYRPLEEEPAPSPSPKEGEDEPLSLSSRIVVSSSSDAFTNSAFSLGSNRDLALNIVNWLAESENQITVRAKDPKVQPISISKSTQNWLYFSFCILIPFLSVLCGLLISAHRRSGNA